MKIGDKIRSLRLIKGLSQENVADLLGISSIAYGDIERNKTDVSHSRLEQIAKALGKSLVELLAHGEQVASIFSNCSNNHVVGIMGSGTVMISEKELKHELEKAQLREANLQLELKNSHLENDNLRLRLEKIKAELKYWKERGE